MLRAVQEDGGSAVVEVENRSRLGHQKAAWAVDRARAELQRMNYQVEPPQGVCVQGPDLVATRGQKRFTVEVKLAIYHRRAWQVNRVTRKDDDVIAIVWPSGAVWFDLMSQHLACVGASGDRYLTALGRFFE
jgi:hypothetical protein